MRNIDADIKNCELAAANEFIPDDAREFAKKQLKEKEKIRESIVYETLVDVTLSVFCIKSIEDEVTELYFSNNLFLYKDQ